MTETLAEAKSEVKTVVVDSMLSEEHTAELRSGGLWKQPQACNRGLRALFWPVPFEPTVSTPTVCSDAQGRCLKQYCTAILMATRVCPSGVRGVLIPLVSDAKENGGSAVRRAVPPGQPATSDSDVEVRSCVAGDDLFLAPGLAMEVDLNTEIAPQPRVKQFARGICSDCVQFVLRNLATRAKEMGLNAPAWPTNQGRYRAIVVDQKPLLSFKHFASLLGQIRTCFSDFDWNSVLLSAALESAKEDKDASEFVAGQRDAGGAEVDSKVDSKAEGKAGSEADSKRPTATSQVAAAPAPSEPVRLLLDALSLSFVSSEVFDSMPHHLAGPQIRAILAVMLNSQIPSQVFQAMPASIEMREDDPQLPAEDTEAVAVSAHDVGLK